VGVRGRATHRELRDDSIAIARGLTARGVGRGTRVGLLMPNRAEWIAAALAVWRCGAILVPLSTLATRGELGHFLRSAHVALLLSVRRFLRHDYEATLAQIRGAGLPALHEVVWLEDDPGDAVRTLAAPGDTPAHARTAEVGPEDPATVTF